MQNYTMNKVDGFNPYDFIEIAKNKDGEPFIQDDGKPLSYLSTDAKKLWFNLVKPNGRIVSRRMETQNPRTCRYRVSIYMDMRDEIPKVEWEHQETAIGDEDFDIVSSKAQTVALGKALSLAGFGSEIEAYLHLTTEGESEEQFVLADTQNTVEKEAPKEEVSQKEDASQKEDLLSLLDQEGDMSYEEALNQAIECTDFAKTTMKSFEGKTFKDILEIPGKELFYEKVLKHGVQVTEKTLNAARRLQKGA